MEINVDSKVSWKIMLEATIENFENQEDSIVFNYDLIYLISKYLSSKDILHLGLTCKKMFYLITQNHFLKRYHWTKLSSINKNETNHHSYYKEILKYGRKPLRYYPLCYDGPFDRYGQRKESTKMEIE